MNQELTIVNEQAVDALLAHITKDGDEVILSADAAKAIATFKNYQKQINDMEVKLKEAISNAMESFNATTVRGQTVTISKGAPQARSRFKLQEGFKHEWGKQQVSYVPDVDKIEEYIKLNDATPAGVELQDVKPVITIRLKK